MKHTKTFKKIIKDYQAYYDGKWYLCQYRSKEGSNTIYEMVNLFTGEILDMHDKNKVFFKIRDTEMKYNMDEKYCTSYSHQKNGTKIYFDTIYFDKSECEAFLKLKPKIKRNISNNNNNQKTPSPKSNNNRIPSPKSNRLKKKTFKKIIKDYQAYYDGKWYLCQYRSKEGSNTIYEMVNLFTGEILDMHDKNKVFFKIRDTEMKYNMDEKYCTSYSHQKNGTKIYFDMKYFDRAEFGAFIRENVYKRLSFITNK